MIEQNHECYVSLEVAKLLKEAGFDWECDRFYDCTNSDCVRYEEYSSPTLDVAQRWLREVKNHHICISFLFANNHKYYVFISRPSKRGYFECDCGWIENKFDTYEEAQEAGIKKTLEIVLEKGE